MGLWVLVVALGSLEVWVSSGLWDLEMAAKFILVAMRTS